MSGQNLTDLDLVAAAEGVAAGRFSARELVEAALQRIERWNPVVNAFISVDADACLQAADAADAARAAGRDLGPLHGVPLAHKDLFDRKGYQATCGSKVRRDRVAAGTATVLERLDAAGALNLGGLNMSELATGPTGHNLHYGHCRNPWNPERFTGGSSSGTGAAVAARLVPGGLGTDTGGSIRLPSAFCGIVGLKPTQGRVSRHGVMGLSFSLDNIGPMTRTVRDCARMTDVLAGHDPLDTTSARLPPPNCEALRSPPPYISSNRVRYAALYLLLRAPRLVARSLCSVPRLLCFGEESARRNGGWVSSVDTHFATEDTHSAFLFLFFDL